MLLQVSQVLCHFVTSLPIYLLLYALTYSINCTFIGELPEKANIEGVKLLRWGRGFVLNMVGNGFVIKGGMQIIRSLHDEKRFLEFDNDFSVTGTSASNLRIYFTMGSKLTTTRLDLGTIKSTTGRQNYNIIDGTNITGYTHLVMQSGSNSVINAPLHSLPTANTLIFSKDFTNYAHSVMGTSELQLTPQGNYRIYLLNNFSVTAAPGIYVYLTKTSGTPQSNDIEIGPLKSLTGVQDYPVPKGLNIFSMNYILIHCKPFNIPLGNAKLTRIP